MYFKIWDNYHEDFLNGDYTKEDIALEVIDSMCKVHKEKDEPYDYDIVEFEFEMSSNTEKLVKEYLTKMQLQSAEMSLKQYEIVLKMCTDYANLVENDFLSFKFIDFVELFNFNVWVKENVFSNRKSIIASFLNYCVSTNNATKVISKELERLNCKDLSQIELFEKCYFKDFNELYTVLIDKASGNDVELVEKNIMAISALILAWYGFTLTEISFIENKHFNSITGEIYCDRTKHKTIIDNENARLLLGIAQKAEGIYRKMPTCKEESQMFVPFVSDKFLIKSIRNVKVSSSNLRNLIAVFSKNLKLLDLTDADYKRIFAYKYLRLNGIYSRIYDAEILLNQKIEYGKNITTFDNELNGEILEGVNPKSKDTCKSRMLVHSYKNWKKHFYGIQ